MRACTDGDRPLVAWRVGELKVRMEPDRHWHRFRAHVADGRHHLEHAVTQRVRHLNRVGKRPLFHPCRLTEELEPAGDGGAVAARIDRQKAPLRRRRQKAMYRNRAADVPEAHVERVALAVGVERLFIETIDPRTHERDAGLIRIGFERVHVGVRPAQDVVPFHCHAEGDVADRRCD